MSARIAVIIPVLNEGPSIAGAVQRVRSAGATCIVVDGGSDDDSMGRAAEAGAWVVSARRGRAAQMNVGALRAGAFEVLLFLHADVVLPQGWHSAVLAAVDEGAVWGRFDVKLDSDHPLLGMVAAMMNLRSRLTGIATGDQAIFIRRATFDVMGGYADMPLMEDIELCGRLRRARLPRACLREAALVSARRWESRGVIRTILLMWWLRLLFWLGVSSSRLHGAYYGQRR
jgi:rSAM/selenodomain-associated transferase 2